MSVLTEIQKTAANADEKIKHLYETAFMERVLDADVVCWATPIYYYEMSGQMKALIDRMNAMYTKDYRFRDIYLLTTASLDKHSATPEFKKYSPMMRQCGQMKVEKFEF